MESVPRDAETAAGLRDVAALPVIIEPLFVVLLGLAFLLKALGVLSAAFVDIAWPILLILIGGMKMMKGKCKCCQG